MNRHPALQFYPGDWHRDLGVQSLNFESRGVWFEILLRMHDSEERGAMVLNGKAMNDEDLATSIGWRDGTAKLRQILENIVAKGVADFRKIDGALICRKMVRANHLSEVRSIAGAAGAAATNAAKLSAKPAASLSISTSSSISSSATKETSSVEARRVAEELLAVWNEGRSPRECSRLTDRRLAKVRARLSEFEESQLHEVVRKLKGSRFHNGDNDRGWKAPGPEWVLSSTEKVEQWLAKGNAFVPRMADPAKSRHFALERPEDLEDARNAVPDEVLEN